MCAINDSEPFKFTSGEVKRKTRKEHTCGECRRKIRSDETYRYLTGISGYDSSRWNNDDDAIPDVARIIHDARRYIGQLVAAN